MTGKPPDNAPMHGQNLITTADMIPGFICRFCAGRAGKRRPGRGLTGTTGSGDSIIVNDGRVPDTPPEYHGLTGHHTMGKNVRENEVERTAGYRNEKNAGAVFPNAGIIIQKPEGT